MKISFVIPAYNEENVLKACLDSILAEAEGAGVPYEIIVVNNASTDQTKNIALTYPQVRVVDESRKGISFARQAGFVCSQGGLVANIDADTTLPAGWLYTVLAAFAKDRELACISGPQIFPDMPRWFNFGIWAYYVFAYAFYCLNRFVFDIGSMVQGGNFVVRREALAKISGFDTKFNFYGEDTDIARRLHKVGAVVFTLRLPIFASSRRLKAEGWLKVSARYVVNYFWTLFFGRPFNKRYADIRSK